MLNWENIENKPLEIVAAGKISRTGQIYEDYNVESVVINETYLPLYVYDITLTGINYDECFYITPVTSTFGDAEVGVVRNYEWLRVVIYGSDIGSEFDFIVYDIP